MNKIKFGTDGWRGIIAQDFSFCNVMRVSQAIADYLGKGKEIAVGYDTRFMSREYALLISKVLCGSGIKIRISQTTAPTPMLSFYIKQKELDGGIMVTASHNPWMYNGIKFKEPAGCSGLPKTMHKIEELLDANVPRYDDKNISETNMAHGYLSALKKYIITKYMKRRTLRIVVDSMYGAGGYYLEKILKGYGHMVVTIHGEPNPIFPGINPEPIEKNMRELSSVVKKSGADIGIATDGDADRAGIVDDRGNVLTPHYVLSLLLLHLLDSRKWSGAVVKTISSTMLINRISEKYSIPIKETPVGFKHIADLMLKEDILIGGEESGGNGFKNHIPERDGLLTGLLLVEMIGKRGRKLSRIVADMEKEFGVFKYDRIDLHVSRDKINNLLNRLKSNPPDNIDGKGIKEIKSFDGTKFIFNDGTWLLIRASGTEPVLRIYAEAPTKTEVARLIKKAKEMI